MPTPSQATITLSPQDRIQATKHHPEFQRLLAIWRYIIRKEQAGIERTDAEKALLWAPRSMFNVEAEMEASRYGLLSLAEREHATMSEEELAWRDCAPQLDWKNKVAIVHVPLWWTIAAIEKIVGQIVRVYKERIGLQRTRPPQLDGQNWATQLDRVNQTATLRVPLDQPVDAIEKAVGRIVRTYKKDLGLSSSQRLRRPEHVDPWEVYRLHQDERLSCLAITHQLFGTCGSPAYDEELNTFYSRVKRAYQFANNAIDFIGQEYAQKDS